MIRVNKNWSLAAKLMTLVLMVSAATSCESCKGDDKEPIAVAFDPKEVTANSLTSKLTLSNNTDKEFDAATSKLKLCVTVTMFDKDGKPVEDNNLLAGIKYDIVYKSNSIFFGAGKETQNDLSTGFKQKMASKGKESFDFDPTVPTDTDLKNGSVVKIEFKVSLEEDKVEKSKDILTYLVK